MMRHDASCINLLVKLHVNVCIIQPEQKHFAGFTKVSQTLIFLILSCVGWSPAKCIPNTAHFTDAHKTPWKFKYMDSSEHKTIDQAKAWNTKVFWLLKMNDESKGWILEMRVILTHFYDNKII